MKATLFQSLILLCAAAVAATAAECRAIDGDFIRAADLAALNPAFAAVPPDSLYGYAPRPGAQRVATPGDLTRFAHAHGITAEFESLCFVRESAPPDPKAAATAMRASLGEPDARIEIVEMSRFPAPPGEMVFPRESLAEPVSGGLAVWNGYIDRGGKRYPVWAKARIGVLAKRLVAANAVRAGQILTESDVRVETTEAFPRRVMPLSSAAAAVGLVARRMINAGAPIAAAALAEPNAVDRGETVVVEVRSGSAILKLEAKAEAAGRRGDVIPLRNTTSGKVFRARIEDKGRLTLDCDGPRSFR
jgi:flagella basal body P-ring formation protein FlgA